MISKIDISDIIRDHISTFVDYGTNRRKPSDFVLFFGMPIFLSLILVLCGAKLSENVSSILVTVFSIFAALLFNLLMMIYDLLGKPTDWQGNLKFRLRYLREIYSNVSYAIIVAIVTVTIVFLSYVDLQWLKPILAFIVFVLTINFILTMLMVLKRTHSLFLTELRDRSEKITQ